MPTLRDSLSDPSLDVMNFLNEVVLRHPEAISFAPGRPWEAFFDVEGSLAEIDRFAAHRAAADGRSKDAVFADLGQYGATNGLIRQLIAQHLALDEGIEVPAESIIVTAGCQEAMLILLMGLFEPATDVLLVSDPTYIGITGLAQIFGLTLHPVATGDHGLTAADLAEAIRAVRATGKRPKAIYDIPDFNNPAGTTMPLAARRELIATARRENLLIFEDNPYGMFAFDQQPVPTLKALDRASESDSAPDAEPVVIYLGSFSKTLYPGLRLGYLVADQQLESPGGSSTLLAEELSKVKSLTTVNTPPLTQAIAGGILLRHEGSLRTLVAGKIPFYRDNRDTMLAALERYTKAEGLPPEALRWNHPGGGFFLTLTLSFPFDQTCLEESVGDYGVISCPMAFFSLAPGREHQVRLSFSYVSGEQIEEGVRRFVRFVADRA